MKMQFLGASNLVTGSLYHINTSDRQFIVDCGQFQGTVQEEKHNMEEFRFTPSDIDFIILTHSHIDHCGRIPKLVKEGFHGKIYCTYATRDLCNILLQDSGSIHENETSLENEKRKKAGLDSVDPYYTKEDAIFAMQYFYPIDYEKIMTDGNVNFVLRDAGHLLGSATVELSIKEDSKSSKLVFSGDLGTSKDPLLSSPKNISDTDYLFVESTYGNRLHTDVESRALKLAEIIIKTFNSGGTIIIPAFSVGRTQEILFELNNIEDKYILKKLKGIPFYVDSPLAISAFGIYRKNMKYFKESIQEKYSTNTDDFLKYSNVHIIEDHQDSMRLNFSSDPKVIISASGMCDAGRIQHHLKYFLPLKNTAIIFVGYQSVESTGRQILENNSVIKIGPDDVANNAQIYKVNGFSGHGDKNDILNWIKNFDSIRKKIIVIHGEDDSRKEFADYLRSKTDNKDILIPNLFDIIEL